MIDHEQRSVVHRGLVNDVKILHRDISSHNILMYPNHNPDTTEGKNLVEKPPIFINQVLRRDKTGYVVQRTKELRSE